MIVKGAGQEFWRGIPAISQVFKPDTQPESYVPDAATHDMRMYAPFTETVASRPLWISPQRNMWCDILLATSAGLVNRHYHPHEVFAYTISGQWSYLEHDWVATRGDFVYESPGEGHTLVAHEHEEAMRVLFIVKGPLIWLDRNGHADGYFDVHDYIAMCRTHYEAVGLGAAYVDGLFR
ncbi:2,4'-dihydroxyacetophenone dioxygenase family protein [Comamonas composti]|uniref:2,4'-dihydroxyacetophenone dioxygenase family protein n=1 Tax=Comamonas composti TaxID=408558 RepID=UPI0003FF33F4|nr:2,4'-dihydroxyacetophenone dioxygenase family protein [Comamonas composti]